MKKFLLVSLLLLSVSLYAQTTIDFETVGNNWTWTTFSLGSGSFDVVANPSVGGLNTSDSCGKLIVGVNGDPWGGMFSDNIGSFTIDSSNCIIKVLAYKDVISRFNLKLEPPNVDHFTPNTVTNQWEELTFDYTSSIGVVANRLTIIPDQEDGYPRSYGSTNYFDYIRFTPITPVPVELTSFTAAIVGNAVQLNWKTATETNNSGFEILKSVNGSKFSRIGFVEGNGTTTESKSYSFVDRSVKAGENYGYRLKQIDLDGTFEYSKVVNVSGITPSEFSLDQNYPNPFNPSTNVSFSVPVKSNVTIEVFNLIGQKVMTLAQGEFEAGKHSVQLNGSSMSSGIYLFKLTAVGENGSQFTSSKKMTLLK
ncbi:MAG TPA: T9SS type A sorting domain-containing protein [Ignavibacteriaceae bacterium]|nr:T9SS type A sorting domain-containing protein [Ignavibacteriaceae bacterium]